MVSSTVMAEQIVALHEVAIYFGVIFIAGIGCIVARKIRRRDESYKFGGGARGNCA
jgi:hypothetical protein